MWLARSLTNFMALLSVKRRQPLTKFKEPFKELHMDALGIFLWFLRIAWNPLTRASALFELRATLTYIRRYRFEKISYFMWLSDGAAEHKYLNGKTPYRKILGKWNLNLWNKKYWKIYR